MIDVNSLNWSGSLLLHLMALQPGRRPASLGLGCVDVHTSQRSLLLVILKKYYSGCLLIIAMHTQYAYAAHPFCTQHYLVWCIDVRVGQYYLVDVSNSAYNLCYQPNNYIGRCLGSFATSLSTPAAR